jgi:hypothetical protein
MLDTAMSLDVDFMRNQSVGIFPVSNSTPEAVVGELQNIFDTAKASRRRRRGSTGRCCCPPSRRRWSPP